MPSRPPAHPESGTLHDPTEFDATAPRPPTMPKHAPLRPIVEAAVAKHGGETSRVIADPSLHQINSIVSNAHANASYDDGKSVPAILAHAKPLIAHLAAALAAAKSYVAESSINLGVSVEPDEPTEAESEAITLAEIRQMLAMADVKLGTSDDVTSRVDTLLKTVEALQRSDDETRAKLTPLFGDGLTVPEMVQQLIEINADQSARLQGPEPGPTKPLYAEPPAGDVDLDAAPDQPKKKGKGKPASSGT